MLTNLHKFYSTDFSQIGEFCQPAIRQTKAHSNKMSKHVIFQNSVLSKHSNEKPTNTNESRIHWLWEFVKLAMADVNWQKN